MHVPLAKPYSDKQEEKAVIAVLRSGWSTQGPQVQVFEKLFAKYVGSKYAVAVSNGTTALHLALIIADVKPGDEIIVPSFTFIATVNAIIHAGAIPVFVDVDKRTFNIDPLAIEKKITSKTKAIMAVDQVGMPYDYDTVSRIAKKHTLLVIADAACAIGSQYKGKKVGSIADISCFSLHPRKLLSTGEGGMITTNNKNMADNAMIWRSHGASTSDLARHASKKILSEEYHVPGFNYRLTDVQAAIGIEQLKKLSKFLIKRKKIATYYNNAFSKVPFISVPFVPAYALPNWQSYVITLEEDSPLSRDVLMEKLLKKGIATRKGVMASHQEPYYKKYSLNAHLPMTEYLEKATISLPIFYEMTRLQQEYVVHSLKILLQAKR